MERPIAELERFGKKCRMACKVFWTSEYLSAKPLTVGPKRPAVDTGASRKVALSDSFMSESVSHKCLSVTVRDTILLPIV